MILSYKSKIMRLFNKINNIYKFFFTNLLIFIFLMVSACSVPNALKPKKVDPSIPVKAKDRARKNIEEGRGISLGTLGNKKTTYEFSTSNPMWRASLETLDFIPFATVDYSGGMIITDWYSDGSSSQGEALKITVRFLSNEIRSDSLKVIVHKKECTSFNNCNTTLLPETSKIKMALLSEILKKAAVIEQETKQKK